jgi:hypothetical protein
MDSECNNASAIIKKMQRFIISLINYLGLSPLSSRDEPSLRARLVEFVVSFVSLLRAESFVGAGDVEGATLTAGVELAGACVELPDEVCGCEYVGDEIGVLRSPSLFPSRVAPPVRFLIPSPVPVEVVVTAEAGGAHHGLTGLYGFGQYGLGTTMYGPSAEPSSQRRDDKRIPS